MFFLLGVKEIDLLIDGTPCICSWEKVEVLQRYLRELGYQAEWGGDKWKTNECDIEDLKCYFQVGNAKKNMCLFVVLRS